MAIAPAGDPDAGAAHQEAVSARPAGDPAPAAAGPAAGGVRTTGWAVAAALATVLFFLYSVRQILLPFVLAAALAFIAAPLVCWLRETLRFPRLAAILAVYLLFLGLLAGAGWWIGTVLLSEVFDVLNHASEIIHKILVSLLGSEQASLFGTRVDTGRLTQQILSAAQALFAQPAEAFQVTARTLATLFGTILTLVLFLYFLFSGPRLASGLLRLVPPDRRPQIAALAAKAGPVIRRYVRGLVVVVAYTALAAWIGLGLVFGTPHAVLLAVLIGFLELIPVIGPLTAAMLIGIVAVHQVSLWTLVGFAIFATALRLSIDNFIGPLVLGRAVTLHPVAIIFAFLAGGVLLGVLGVLLAVPVMACLKIVLATAYGEAYGEERR